MKILIGYDGSECADTALANLRDAGLPVRAEALVLTVFENLMLIMEERGFGLSTKDEADYFDSETRKKIHNDAARELAEAENLAQSAIERLRNDFPNWQFQSRAAAEFAEAGVLEVAKQFQPDLIVVGSHGRGAFGRFFLGSFSLKVLNEALCSVRVSRRSPARTLDDDSPTRVVIGFDGSPDSVLAVEAVAKRVWRQDSAVRLMTSVEPGIHPNFDDQMQKTEQARRQAVHRLESAGLHVSTVIKLGAAKYLLVSEAEIWGADSVFVGARGHRWMERVFIGSVSYSVAARSACSVEVVRRNGYFHP